jgi:Fe-S cluster assembly ATP-binding protein
MEITSSNSQIFKSSNHMLSIKNLHASVEDKDILKGINLEIKAG